jgi:hypothetical protein
MKKKIVIRRQDMHDESTKRRVSGEEDARDEQLSTADLAGTKPDAPETEITVPRVRAEDSRIRDRGTAPVSESRTETPSERTDIRGETIPTLDAREIGSEGPVTTNADVSRRPEAGSNLSRAAAPAPAMAQETGPLFAGSEANELRSRWDAIQVGFVDEPRRAVEQADNLVAGTMKRLAEIFAEERNRLEHAWDQGENVSTEDLRQALRRYRSFFGRLLSV